MFSLQPSDELVFGIPSTSQEDQIRDDLKSDNASMGSNIISFGSSKNKEETKSTSNNIMKKAMHREIERKGGKKCQTFMLLLLLFFLLTTTRKGSATDQIEEAVSYIKQMQKNIQDLRFRRDKLKELSESNGSDNLSNSVAVNLVDDGLEILMSSSSGIVLSRILAELVERDLDVVSCDSITIEGKFIHKIRVEAASDTTSLDVLVLENGLTNAIK